MGAIVLAGGKSRRMGEDKALLPCGETTMLAHIVELVRNVVGPVIVVADDPELPVKAKLPTGILTVRDLIPDSGPLSGLTAGLITAGDGYHFATACDMPRLVPGIIELLLQSAQGHDVAIPIVNGQLEPFCAVYHGRCAGPFRKALEAGELALYKALAAVNLNRIYEMDLRKVDPELASFTNINTKEEYNSAF